MISTTQGKGRENGHVCDDLMNVSGYIVWVGSV